MMLEFIKGLGQIFGVIVVLLLSVPWVVVGFHYYVTLIRWALGW